MSSVTTFYSRGHDTFWCHFAQIVSPGKMGTWRCTRQEMVLERMDYALILLDGMQYKEKQVKSCYKPWYYFTYFTLKPIPKPILDQPIPKPILDQPIPKPILDQPIPKHILVWKKFIQGLPKLLHTQCHGAGIQVHACRKSMQGFTMPCTEHWAP